MNTEMKSETVIQVKDLGKTYHIYENPHDRLKQIFFGWRKNYFRNFFALQDVTFDVLKGQSVGIIGKNGAGKSTLLQLLTGTLTPSSGKVVIKGKVAAVLELGSGFNPEFTGRENIYLYASLFELKRSTIKDRFHQIVEFSELADFIDQPVKTYSSGMQARLAFSVIAHVDADILIIDEALSVGDAFFSQKCMRFLRQFQKNGTILFVSHDLAAVTTFCDQAIWLEKGIVRDFGEAKDICEKYFAEIYMQHSAGGNLSLAVSETNQSTEKPNHSAENQNEIIEKKVVQKKDTSLPPGAQHITSFGFNLESTSFGSGEAKITGVEFTDSQGRDLAVCEGGQDVIVSIIAKAINDINMPILGFIIKDRLGQYLIGGNTFHAYKDSPVRVDGGNYLKAEFHFKLPILAIGDYSLVGAIANGTLQEHVQLHWLHDAVLFKVISTSIDGVLVGAPLDEIILTTMRNH